MAVLHVVPMKVSAAARTKGVRKGRDRRRDRVREHDLDKRRHLVWRMIHAYREADRLRRKVERAHCSVLRTLREGGVYRDLGHVRFGDFCREALGLRSRTAQRRIALDRIFSISPEAEARFLDGDLDASRLLALRPVLTPGTASAWLAVARGLPVRELERWVREACRHARESGAEEAFPAAGDGDGGDAASPEDDGTSPEGDGDDPHNPAPEPVVFRAPLAVGLGFEHALETAQRVLGWEAPRDECLDAVLTEAEAALPWLAAGPPPAKGDGERGPAGGRREDRAPDWAPGGRLPWASDPFAPVSTWRTRSGARGTGGRRRPGRWRPSLHRFDYKRARRALQTLQRVSRRSAGLCRIGLPGREPDRPAAAVALLERCRRLDALDRPLLAGQMRLLDHLHRMDAAGLFGLGDLAELGPRLFRLSRRTILDRWLAGAVLQRHPAIADAFLRGDIDLGHVLLRAARAGEDDPAWIRRARSVTFRQFRRETRFLRRLGACLWWPEEGLPVSLPDPGVEAGLRRRLYRAGWSPDDLDRTLDDQGLLPPPGSSGDPAENPVAMARLETLLDLVVLATCRIVSDDDPAVRYRKTLSPPGRHHRVVVRARPEVRRRWESAVAATRARVGPVPEWAVAVLASEEALREWAQQDPDRIPTERRILERDGYRCLAPGCGARRNLEVHHIVYRSRGGSNAPANLVTLCHAHHHHAQHRGTLRVRGEAPHALIWEVGLAPGRPPVWVYRGERRLRPGRGRAP